MKIFGKEIFSKRVIIFKDEVPEIKAVVPDTLKPAIIRAVKDPTLKYRGTRSTGRGAFNPAEYDLAEIGRIEDTDSYARQAFDKKVALMFKENWDITGKNRAALSRDLLIQKRTDSLKARRSTSTSPLLAASSGSTI